MNNELMGNTQCLDNVQSSKPKTAKSGDYEHSQ